MTDALESVEEEKPQYIDPVEIEKQLSIEEPVIMTEEEKENLQTQKIIWI